MKKATHNGTCQVCGREQALPGGLLAKHGYTVEHHFFEGVCPGAERLPLEIERNVADEVAVMLMERSKEAAKVAEGLKAGKRFPLFADSGRRVPDGKGRLVQERVPYAEAPANHQVHAVRVLIANMESESRSAESMSKQIISLADSIHGKKPLSPRVADERKPIEAGTRVKLHGREVTVLRVETRVAQGCGPFLNGHPMPHVVYAREDGREFAYPVRLIRQSSIIG